MAIIRYIVARWVLGDAEIARLVPENAAAGAMAVGFLFVHSVPLESLEHAARLHAAYMGTDRWLKAAGKRPVTSPGWRFWVQEDGVLRRPTTEERAQVEAIQGALRVDQAKKEAQRIRDAELDAAFERNWRLENEARGG